MEFRIRFTFSLKCRWKSLDNVRQSLSLRYGRLPRRCTSRVTRQLAAVEFYLYPTVGTVLIHSVKPELTE